MKGTAMKNMALAAVTVGVTLATGGGAYIGHDHDIR